MFYTKDYHKITNGLLIYFLLIIINNVRVDKSVPINKCVKYRLHNLY